MPGQLILSISFALILSVPAMAGADTLPTATELIAAMPEEVESVMLIRSEISADQSVWRDDFGAWFGVNGTPAPGAKGEPPREIVASSQPSGLNRMVENALFGLNPKLRLLAGWEFKAPHGIGAGESGYLTAMVTETSNEALRQKIEAKVKAADGVAQFEEAGTPIFRSEVETPPQARGDPKQKKEVFVAFPSEHLTFIAWSEAPLRRVCKALKAPRRPIPERWKALAAEVDLESPIVILRAMPTPKVKLDVRVVAGDRIRVSTKEIEISGFALVAPDRKTVAVRICCKTNDPDVAVNYFYGQTYSGGLEPPNWTWSRQSDGTGFTAKVEFQPPKPMPSLAGLILMTLFGVMVAL